MPNSSTIAKKSQFEWKKFKQLQNPELFFFFIFIFFNTLILRTNIIQIFDQMVQNINFP